MRSFCVTLILVGVTVCCVTSTFYDASDDDVDAFVTTMTDASPTTFKCPDRCVCSSVVVNCIFLNISDASVVKTINQSVEIL